MGGGQVLFQTRAGEEIRALSERVGQMSARVRFLLRASRNETQHQFSVLPPLLFSFLLLLLLLLLLSLGF
jgi:hypothetical protein